MKFKNSVSVIVIFGMLVMTSFFGTLSTVQGAITTLPGYEGELFATITSGGDQRYGLVQIDEAPDGTIFVGQDFYDASSQIFAVNPDGTWSLFGSPSVPDPDAVTVDSAGTVFTGGDGYIYQITPSGASTPLTGREYLPAGPVRLEVSPSDQLYAIQRNSGSSNGDISEVSSTGVKNVITTGNSITFDDSGNFYILRDSTVYLRNPDGSEVTFLTGVPGGEVEFHPSGAFLTIGTGVVYITQMDGSGSETLASGFHTPTDLTVASSGDIFVSDYFDIYRIYSVEENEPPVADAGEDAIVNEGDLVEFDGSSSSDPDGSIMFYEWDLDASNGLWWDTGESPDATGPTPSHVFGDDGVFIATLRVIDNENLTDTNTCNVTVINVNPLLSIESVVMHVEIGLRVAGRKINDVGMTLFEEGNPVGYVSIERMPGSPNEQMAWIPMTLDMTKTYSASVTFTPEDPPNIGGNPVWIYIKLQNGTIMKIHHTFNVQQSKERNSDHWNHIEPWEVDLNMHLLGCSFDITTQISDPGSDDEHLACDYESQSVTSSYYNNAPTNTPDLYPSPEVNPVFIIVTISLFYEGPETITLNLKDDDNIRLSTLGTIQTINIG